MKRFPSNPEETTKYNKMVRAVVNSLLLNRHISALPIDRDDLYQLGWVALLQCIPHFDPNRGVKLETYASRVIVNAVNNEIMKYSKKRLNTLHVDVPGEAPTGEPAVNQMLESIIEVAAQSLTRSEQEVFWKRVLDDKTFDEIGKDIGFSRETARKIFGTSLGKIKEAVG